MVYRSRGLLNTIKCQRAVYVTLLAEERGNIYERPLAIYAAVRAVMQAEQEDSDGNA